MTGTYSPINQELEGNVAALHNFSDQSSVDRDEEKQPNLQNNASIEELVDEAAYSVPVELQRKSWNVKQETNSGVDDDKVEKAWYDVSRIVLRYDENKVQDCKEDMDTLLVFAGLFSAVMTAFNIEYYKVLQQDPVETTQAILLQISQQLSNSNQSTSSSFTGSLGMSTSSNSRPPSAVQINALWFLSLVASLITASLGILVKQWLREYVVHENLSPRAHIRIRHFRSEGLLRFQVFEIAALLPLLLQLALLLFFLGLAFFLVDLDPVLGWIISPFLVVWIVLFTATSLGPAFFPQCPYKTPFLKEILRPLRKIIYSLATIITVAFKFRRHRNSSEVTASESLWKQYLADLSRSVRYIKQQVGYFFYLLSWPYRRICDHDIVSEFQEMLFAYRKIHPDNNETLARSDATLDIPALVAADSIFMDDNFLDTSIQCLSEEGLGGTMFFVHSILQHRLNLSPRDTLGSWRISNPDNIGHEKHISTESLNKLRSIILDALIDFIDVVEVTISGNPVLPGRIYDALAFVTAPWYKTRHQELGEINSRLLDMSDHSALQVLANLCKRLINVTYLDYIKIKTSSALVNTVSAATALLEIYRSNLPTQSNEEFVEGQIPNDTYYPDDLCYIVLSLLDHSDTSLLSKHREMLKELQTTFSSTITHMKSKNPEKIFIYCAMEDVTHQPCDLLWSLDEKVEGIVEDSFISTLEDLRRRAFRKTQQHSNAGSALESSDSEGR
ncbi:hypothetical protein ABKN59_009713 [Abortiporus biennis]